MAGHNAPPMAQLIGGLQPSIVGSEYLFVETPSPLGGPVVDAYVNERGGHSSVVPREEAMRLGLSGAFPCRRIDLGIDTPLSATGFLARLLSELAQRGIPVNPVAGYRRDHLYVPVERADETLAVLRSLAASARLSIAREIEQGPRLVPFAPAIWIADGPELRLLTMRFGTRMTVVRLANGELLVHSPVALTKELDEEVTALGEVRYLVAPNRLHHLFLRGWAERFPDARVYGARGVAAKEPALDVIALIDAAPREWGDDLDQLVFRGSPVMEEVVFHHRASRTTIVADLVENFDPLELGWKDRLLARIGGVLAPRGGMPRDWRATFVGSGRRTARHCVARMLEWDPMRVVLAHGRVAPVGGRAFLEGALAPFVP